MSGSARRVAAIAATIPVIAALVLAAVPFVSAGVTVQTASVTINKVTDPASDAQDFLFYNNFIVSQQTTNTLDTDATSAGTPSSYQFTVGEADFGYVIVSEDVPSGWYLTDIQCTGDDDVSYNVLGDNVSLQADAGEDINCTFYNTKRAQLTLEKETEPGNDPKVFSFDLTGDALPATWELDTDPNSAFTNSNITWSVLPDELGAYTITEDAAAGWLLMDITCTGAGDDGSVNLETRTATLDIDAGELVICTFTNGKLPLLRLTKVTDPASDPQDFYLDVLSIFNTGLDTDPSSLDTLSTDWTSLADDELGPRVVEETPVEGWTLTAISCPGDTEAVVDLENNRVTLDVDADENIHCTFTNTKDADETEPPPTDEPVTDPPETPDPTDDQGGVTDGPTEPGTSTEGASADGTSTLGIGVAIVALILLSGVLLFTRPKRARK